MGKSTGLAISYPYDHAVFPPEIAAPQLSWIENHPSSDRWLVMVEFGNGTRLVYAVTSRQHWTPDQTIWELIKANSVDSRAKITVYGFEDEPEFPVTAKSSIRIFTSKDPVGASIFFRQV